MLNLVPCMNFLIGQKLPKGARFSDTLDNQKHNFDPEYRLFSSIEKLIWKKSFVLMSIFLLECQSWWTECTKSAINNYFSPNSDSHSTKTFGPVFSIQHLIFYLLLAVSFSEKRPSISSLNRKSGIASKRKVKIVVIFSIFKQVFPQNYHLETFDQHFSWQPATSKKA